MSERTARLSADGIGAYCYGCGGPLAVRGAFVQLAAGLVERPDRERRTGLPRYGPPRRKGHADRRAVGDLSTRAGFKLIGNPGAFYVNCPVCDRGQVVRWPTRTSRPAVLR